MRSIGSAKGAFVVAVLLSAAVLVGACGSGEAGTERAVEWHVDRPLGPSRARLIASVKTCSDKLPRIESPIIDYEGDRAYVELRVAPEDEEKGHGVCFLQLLTAFKTVHFDRDLSELVLFDSSTDPPQRRWPE